MSRTKGHSFERQIAVALRVVYPGARRWLENHKDDANGVDLVDTGHYRFQLKRGRKPAPLSKLKEVQCDEALGEVPVLVTQGDFERVLVALPFEEFLRLLKVASNA